MLNFRTLQIVKSTASATCIFLRNVYSEDNAMLYTLYGAFAVWLLILNIFQGGLCVLQGDCSHWSRQKERHVVRLLQFLFVSI
jgi:hypothetical protein